MTQQIKLTREELYQKIWEKPTVKVAAELGISDVGLGKIWRRIETGAKVDPAPLPPVTETTVEYVFLYIPKGSDQVSAEIQAKINLA